MGREFLSFQIMKDGGNFQIIDARFGKLCDPGAHDCHDEIAIGSTKQAGASRTRVRNAGLTGLTVENLRGLKSRARSCDQPIAQFRRGKILRDRNAKRSEERRVGKECRSRWSPY